MKRSTVVVAVLIAVIALLLANIYVTERDSSRLGEQSRRLAHQITVVCKEHQALAEIAQQEVAEAVQGVTLVTPNVNIPGITHQALLELTEKKRDHKIANLARLESIRKETC